MICLYYTTERAESREVLAHVLEEYYGIRDAARRLQFSLHGKPYLKDVPVRFNLSHSGTLTAVAAGRHPVGLDVQLRDEKPRETLRSRLTPAEREEDFFRLWTAKEAYIKYRGGLLCAGVFPCVSDLIRTFYLMPLYSPPSLFYDDRDIGERREKEGLEQEKGFFAAPGLETGLDGHVTITENGVVYDVDYIDGQKTGFFLDQKYNRQAAARLAKGRRVLDCFTHTGSFALNAVKGGAAHVTAVDISADAIALARANCARNGLEERMDFVTADVFQLLTRMAAEGRRDYDFIILDPPAFTKSSATVKNAFRGYKEINLKAMRLLPRGGYLATCSCSHFATEEKFVAMLHSAAKDAGVQLRQIEARQQSPDHPILWNVEETNYLKFFLFQVV